MTKQKFIYFSSFFTYTIQGMVTISLGLLMPHMMSSYNIDYSQGGTMIFCLLGGGVISSTFGGVLINRLGEKMLTIIGALCIIFGYGVMLFVNNVTLIYFLLTAVGLGTGFFNITLNTLVANVSNSDNRKINALHTFFAVGALLVTLLIAFITYYKLSWKLFLYVVLTMTGICVFLFSIMTVEHHKEKVKPKKNDLSFFKKPYIYIFVSLLFLYVGIEGAINGWAVTFLNESGIVSASASNYVLSVLWILVIIGRLINRRIKKSVTLESRLIVCSIIILLSYILLIKTSSAVFLVISVVVLGLAMSAFYPNSIANSSEKIKDNATALGLILSFGGLGGAVIPWVNGVVADHYGLNAGMMVVIVFILLLIFASSINVFLKGENESNT